jgi:predicted RNase H-like HicB family nuclease
MEKYHITIEKDPDSNWLVAQCVEHPQALTQGRTIDECIKNMQEALDILLKNNDYHKSRLVFEVPAM